MFYKISIKLNEKKLPFNSKNQINVEGERYLKKIVLEENGIFVYIETEEKFTDMTYLLQLEKNLLQYLIVIMDIEMKDHQTEYYTKEKDSEQWKKMKTAIISNIVNVNFSNISIQSSAQNFIEMILGYKKIPYPLIQLKNAKKINNNNDKFVAIITACELSVKEFYINKLPDLGILLEEVSSPPVVKLLGNMFLKYFSKEFPKELRKKLDGLIRIRNKIVHTSDISVSFEENHECYITVLKIVNFLNKLEDNGYYNNWYDEEISLIPQGISTSQIEISDKLKSDISNSKLEFNMTIDNSIDSSIIYHD